MGTIHITRSALLAICFVAMGCTAAGQTPPSGAEDSLRAAATAWEQAFVERDGERVASFFADDIVAMYPQPYPRVGIEANREAWIRVFQSPATRHPIRIDEVHASGAGDLGYSFGMWWLMDAESDRDLGGRFLAVWKLIGEEWKIVRLSANTHQDVDSGTAPR
jgi:ketosteroid isomerase-like protein